MNWRVGVWVVLATLGLVMISAGVWWWRAASSDLKVEVIKAGESEEMIAGKIWVDVGGAVVVAGVYQLDSMARVKDALAAAGGLAADADRTWVERSLNMAQNLVDGYKIFIPGKNADSGSEPGMTGGVVPGTGCVSINTASQSELDSLTGIGEVRAEGIIDGRPYGRLEELVEKKIISKSVYDKLKQDLCL